jgi:hypothetical protein
VLSRSRARYHLKGRSVAREPRRDASVGLQAPGLGKAPGAAIFKRPIGAKTKLWARAARSPREPGNPLKQNLFDVELEVIAGTAEPRRDNPATDSEAAPPPWRTTSTGRAAVTG